MKNDGIHYTPNVCPKYVHSGILRRVISCESLRVEGQVSPFWKLDIQGYNIYQIKKNKEFRPWTPSIPSTGVQVKITDFSRFDICHSPEYLVSKIGSLAPQLTTAHVI